MNAIAAAAFLLAGRAEFRGALDKITGAADASTGRVAWQVSKA